MNVRIKHQILQALLNNAHVMIVWMANYAKNKKNSPNQKMKAWKEKHVKIVEKINVIVIKFMERNAVIEKEDALVITKRSKDALVIQ